MTDAQKKQLHEKILSEIERLKQDVIRLSELTDPKALEDLDEVSRMDAIVSKSVHDTTLSTAKQRISKLEYALKRLKDDPEFGYCNECGEEIPMPRLLSMPETVRCVDCAE